MEISENSFNTDALLARFNASETSICLEDLTDPQNRPCTYTKTKRGVAKAWQCLKTKAASGEITTMRQAETFLIEQKIRLHSWCAMD